MTMLDNPIPLKRTKTTFCANILFLLQIKVNWYEYLYESLQIRLQYIFFQFVQYSHSQWRIFGGFLGRNLFIPKTPPEINVTNIHYLDSKVFLYEKNPTNFK